MIGADDKRPLADFLRSYQILVAARYPSSLPAWPLLNGWNILVGGYEGWQIVVLKDAGFSNMTSMNGMGELPDQVLGSTSITPTNRDATRSRLERTRIAA
jgi:hypothetical protein